MGQRDVRKTRIKHDYELMKNMKGFVIDFKVDDEENPTNYTIYFHIRTCIGTDASGRPIYRDTSVVDLTLPPDYPFSPPVAHMRDRQPAHVNWYRDRQWCYGHWMVEEPLWSYVRRMAKTIQFAPEYTNVNSPANRDCIPLWNEGLRKGWFPCDKQNLPTGDKKRRRIRFVS